MSAPSTAAADVALALIETAPDKATAERQAHMARESGASRSAIRRAWNGWQVSQRYRPVRP